MSGDNNLPEGWISTQLESISNIVMGQSPPSSAYNERGQGLPFFQGKAEFTDLYPVARKWCDAPTKIAEKDDVLISVRAPVGPTNLAPDRCCIGRGLSAIRPRGGIEHRYILYAIRAFVSKLAEQGTGTTFDAISGDVLRDFQVPLAPIAEQRRIVAAIEEQFTRLDAGVAALKSARIRLKRYRAAVLKAAVEGKLTEAWRAAHPGTEPANVLLARILAERRARWEAEQSAKGKNLAKLDYRAPATPNVDGLPNLPSTWAWAAPEQLASTERYSLAIGPFGSNLKVVDYRSSGVPLVFVRNIRSGVFDGPDTQYVSEEKAIELRAHQAKGGDILITKMGDPPGDACLYPRDMPAAIVTADCIKWTLAPGSGKPEFFVNAINSLPIKVQVLAITKGVAQPKMSLERFSGIAIPVPPIPEQEEIVAEVERRLSVLNALEASIETGLQRAERLRQSILAEAFAGRLVPQDPADEPASGLLARIRAGREAAESARPNGAGRAGRKERRRAAVASTGTFHNGPAEAVDGSALRQGTLWPDERGG